MMKRLHHLTLACSLLMLAGSRALGSDLVLSSLRDAGGSGFFVDSSGQALASGSLVQVVDCGELTETEIRELAAGGVETLLNAVTPFGDPAVIGQHLHGKTVLDIKQMPELARKMHIQIGILTVTASVAQSVADSMIDAGIRGIWNFTPASLEVPDHVILHREELASSLAVLSHRLLLLTPHNNSN